MVKDTSMKTAKIKVTTANILRNLGKTTDEAIINLWNRHNDLKKELKDWRKIAKCNNPSEFLLKRYEKLQMVVERGLNND